MVAGSRRGVEVNASISRSRASHDGDGQLDVSGQNGTWWLAGSVVQGQRAAAGGADSRKGSC